MFKLSLFAVSVLILAYFIYNLTNISTVPLMSEEMWWGSSSAEIKVDDPKIYSFKINISDQVRFL